MTLLYEAAAKTLSASIEHSAHYAVELNPHDAGVFRQHLSLLAAQVGKASSVEDYDAIRSSFRGELRDYRDRTSEETVRLRDEIKANATAMQIFAEGLTTGTDEHETRIQQEFSQLEAAANSGDAAAMSKAIGRATRSVSQSCEEMRRGNQMVVIQLQDELRALHQEIEKERRSLCTDQSSGVWNRQKIDSRIEDLLRKPDPFCVLLVGIEKLRGLYAQYSRTAIERSLKALLARFATLLGDEAMIGRWSEDVFVAILDVDPAAAGKLREQAEQKLTGGYAVQENALTRKVVMEVKVGMVARAKRAEAAAFYPKLGQVAARVVETT